MNKKGFTLLEVIVSLTILSIFVVILQRQEVFNIGRKIIGEERTEIIFLIKKQITRLFLLPPTQKPKIKNLKINENPLKITTSFNVLNKRSSLRSFVPFNINVLTSQADWSGERGGQSMKMITFVLDSKEKQNAAT